MGKAHSFAVTHAYSLLLFCISRSRAACNSPWLFYPRTDSISLNMSLLDTEEFVCLDCESTGLDPHKDRIVEIAAARFTFGKISQEFETLIDPECPIPETSQEIHKISQEMVAGKPKIREVLPKLLSMISGH